MRDAAVSETKAPPLPRPLWRFTSRQPATIFGLVRVYGDVFPDCGLPNLSLVEPVNESARKVARYVAEHNEEKLPPVVWNVGRGCIHEACMMAATVISFADAVAARKREAANAEPYRRPVDLAATGLRRRRTSLLAAVGREDGDEPKGAA